MRPDVVHVSRRPGSLLVGLAVVLGIFATVMSPLVWLVWTVGLSVDEARLFDWRLWYDMASLWLKIMVIYLALRLIFEPKGDQHMAGKRYGSGAPEAQKLDPAVEFEVAGLRYDDEEVHEFIATRKVDTVLAGRFINMPDDQAGQLLRLVVKLIGKTLDNKDGVPVQWSPEPVPKPRNAGKNYEPKFRGPDGDLHPMGEAPKFLDFAAGSSRRRWEALTVDEDFTVQMEVLAEVAHDLIEATTARPTVGS